MNSQVWGVPPVQGTVVMSAPVPLNAMAAFAVAFADTQPTRDAVRSILNSSALPTLRARHAALYGYAQAIGATAAVGFDPAWRI